MHPENVREFLTTFVGWAAVRPDIHAIALVGSYARGTASDTSDVDLIIITDDPEAYLGDPSWSDTFGAVIRFEREAYGKVTSLRAWYGNGLEVEYGFTDLMWVEEPLDEGTRQVISTGLQVLFEREGSLTNRLGCGSLANVNPSEQFAVRDADAQDANAVAALISRLGYPTNESEMGSRLAAISQDPTYRTFVATVGTMVIGVACGGLGRYYEKNGLYGRLVLLAVDDQWQRRGIGRALVTAVETWAYAQGANLMLVNSGHHRNDAHRFYERLGYAATGLRFVRQLQ